jgi:glyoxylase-like metal-dependent hydrolase (beta-lactamase superfamily II)
VFGALTAVAFLTAQKSTEPLVHELAPGAFYWQGDEIRRVQTNVGWVIFKDYVLVIDANFPWGAREILPEIKKTTDKPIRFVFNTHYHADHSYGNVVFHDAGAVIVSSSDSAQEFHERGWHDVQNQAKERATEPLMNPSVMFPDRMVFDDGDQRVELIKVGPAHTKGDTVAYLPKSKILFVGDLAVNWVYGNNVSDPGADLHNWVSVLGTLATWDVKNVIPAHGVPGTVATLVGQRDYLQDMLQQVEAGLKTGRTAEQLANEVDLRKYQPFGADPKRTAGQVRSMYRSLSRTSLR